VIVVSRGELPFIELADDCHSISEVHRLSVLFTMLELWKSNCQQLWVPCYLFFVFSLSLSFVAWNCYT